MCNVKVIPPQHRNPLVALSQVNKDNGSDQVQSRGYQKGSSIKHTTTLKETNILKLLKRVILLQLHV